MPNTLDVSLNQTLYFVRDFDPIQISGTNLGYGLDTSDNLTMIIPNTLFEFTPSNQSGTTTISFSKSKGYNKQITWMTDATFFDDYYSYGEFVFGIGILTLSGDFNLPESYYNVTFGANSPCVDIVITSSYLECKVLNHTATWSSPALVTVNSPLKSLLGVINLYVTSSVDSSPDLTTNGGDINLFGNYGVPKPGVKVSINQSPCTVKGYNGTWILCNVNGKLDPGPCRINVTINGFKYSTNKLRVVNATDPPNLCGSLPYCSGNGSCINGACECFTGYAGDLCNDLLQSNITIQPNPTSPGSTILSNSSSFNFNIASIQELDASRTVINELVTSGWQFNTSINGSLTTYRYELNVNITTANASRNDSLLVVVLLESSTEERTVPFAGQTYKYPPNSLKMTIEVLGWAYASTLNTLRVVMMTDSSGVQIDHCGQTQQAGYITDNDSDFRYLKVVKDGVVFFGRFLPFAMADGRPSSSLNEVINVTSTLSFIGLNLPQCRRCIIDPDFSVLIDSQKGGSCGVQTEKVWLIATIASIGGAVLIAAVVIIVLLVKRNKKNKEMKVAMSSKLQEMN
ncbi:hypothetical protein SAMD00019534_037760 [Acytostelium subglobosum LB1]|uniref:hypothetical protein n=1 Tax=Acytostelium subglobosum LB1 TaxID=1410327 RepID=UPI0006447D2F|nr:hypothetical protein SAMD00019534_037760 [Acytostelium subglobosum LB1]GAM20601.1 hypothetical protein SAMD00019534_037760 [Acytostelium subglobosum LB1]|eukprot:XP_012760122.1 hypothetical protein SAMD00019534_037760 [Acytostelium subglobosum LB1]